MNYDEYFLRKSKQNVTIFVSFYLKNYKNTFKKVFF